MRITKALFLEEMQRASISATSQAIKMGDTASSVMIMSFTGTITRHLTEQLFNSGLVGELDLELDRFAVLYTTALSTVIANDPTLAGVRNMLAPIALLLLVDITPGLMEHEEATK